MKQYFELQKIFLGIFLPLMLALAPVYAERPPFKIYTTEEGLAHDRVNRVVRDSRGFLWFCTSEGLSRFDGARFKNYTQDHGLPHREVFDFLEAADGTYLAATKAGIAVFNPNGRAYRWNVLETRLETDGAEPPLFETYAPETENRQARSVLSLAQDRRGRIWAGTADGFFQIVRSDAGTWRFEKFSLGEERAGVGYLFLLADAEGGLFVGASHAVYRIAPDGAVKKLAVHGANAILIAADGSIWLDNGATAAGLKVYAFENDSLKLLKTYTKKDGLPDDSFYFALRQTSDGRIFVGMHDGLCEFLPAAKENEPKFRLLGTDKVTTMAEDAGGNLWIGTELKGAWKLARTGFAIFGEADGIAATDDIRSIHFDNEGRLLLAARPQKILQFADGKFNGIIPAGLVKRSWSWHFLDLQTPEGEWWIPSEKGLLRYPRTTDAAALARTPPKKLYTTADGLPGNEVFNIFRDSRGDLWLTIVGAENSLLRWERATEKFYNYTTRDGLPRYNGPISFAEDTRGSGAIWFGHYFGGLARYRDGKFDFFTAADGLPETLVSDLLFDADGRLWIGTSGYGLFRIDRPAEEKTVFTNISTANGLSSNQIICLTADRFNRIYVGTGRGINRFDANGNIRLFTQADGLPGNYITRCAADRSGFLWFVARNTLVRFAPEIEQLAVSPPVFIDQISVGGVPQKISSLGAARVETLELNSDQRQIEIDFFALAFGAEENIRYQYRLNEQDWSSPTAQQTLNLDLAPGTHELAVRAVRADGVVSERAATVAFKILPPVWQRWWFIALGVLVLAAIVFSFYRYRISNLRAINEALTEAKLAEEKLRKSREERIRELEKVRNRIATDLHDDIGASLTQIAILSEVAQTQSSRAGNGAVAEPLTKISDVSNELVGVMSDIVWSINPTKDHLSDLTQRMRRFASDVLSAKGIFLHFSAPDADREIVVGTNTRREVFLIFKESVNNIVKHADAGQVSIEIDISENDLTLEIRDDGKGFAAEKSFADSLAAIEMGGNGVSSMMKRAAEMGGEFEIESEPGKGTRVKLRLPLEQTAAV